MPRFVIKKGCIPLVALILIIFQMQNFTAEGISFEEDISLTKQQALALQKFKNRVLPKLTQDFMKDDLYLIRWLRARNFDVSRAEEFLLSHLKFRKENRMETIQDEDWSDLESEYVYDLEGVDKEGRPLLKWDLGDWDVRKQATAGKMNRLVRYGYKMWDDARAKVREFELQGKNVTRWTMILNMKNINAVQHINPTSIPFYVTLAAAYDTNWPGMGDNIYLLNTPGLFETVLSLVRPILTSHTRNALKVYGKNENEWGPIVRAAIDEDQLPPVYGGTKKVAGA